LRAYIYTKDAPALSGTSETAPLLSNTRKTDSLRRLEDRVFLSVWRRACAAFALLSRTPYQVKQVRRVLVQHKLAQEAE